MKKKLVLDYTLQCHDGFGLNWPCNINDYAWDDDNDWGDALGNEVTAWTRCDALSGCRFVQHALKYSHYINRPARDHIGLRDDIAGMDQSHYSDVVNFQPNAMLYLKDCQPGGGFGGAAKSSFSQVCHQMQEQSLNSFLWLALNLPWPQQFWGSSGTSPGEQHIPKTFRCLQGDAVTTAAIDDPSMVRNGAELRAAMAVPMFEEQWFASVLPFPFWNTARRYFSSLVTNVPYFNFCSYK